MKICNTCGIEQPLDNFYKNRTKKDKHANYCKTCDNARRMIRYFDNWEDERARIIEWKLKNPEYDKNWIREYRRRQRTNQEV